MSTAPPPPKAVRRPEPAAERAGSPPPAGNGAGAPAGSAVPPPTAAPARSGPAWLQPAGLRRRWGGRRVPVAWGNAGKLKRGLDLLLCLLALPLLLPLAGVCALAVRLQGPGPILFAQWRTGRDGRPFRIWKFRTMVPDAEAMKARLAHLNELPWPDFKITRDPRVTRVGRWLRRSSLDELPQVWNIWRGEMSWVGPRPTDFGIERYQLWHTERLETAPGLTGLWQVLARAQCDFDQRLRLDICYQRAWTPWLDFMILAATVGVVLRGTGAK